MVLFKTILSKPLDLSMGILMVWVLDYFCFNLIDVDLLANHNHEFLTIFCGFILLVFANIQDYPLYQPLIISIVLQLAFILIGGFMINWLSMVGNNVEKSLLLRNFLSIMGMMIAISLLMVTFRDVLKWLVVSILQLVVFAATIPLTPVFNWVENFELKGKVKSICSKSKCRVSSRGRKF
jgi:hypothetical protein